MPRGIPKHSTQTPIFDLLAKATTFEKKLELIKKYRDGLTDGQKGLIGAMLVKFSDQTGHNLSYGEAGSIVGVVDDTILHAMHILRAATEQEMNDVKNGLRGINNLSRIIAKRSPLPRSEQRRRGSNSRGRQMERRLRQQDRAEMWHLLRAGIEGLTSLPLPEEVSTEIRKSYMMRQFTIERLDRALKWLKDFADAFRTQEQGGEAANEAEAGNNHSDAGEGGRAA